MAGQSQLVTRYLELAQAQNTTRAYASDWAEFQTWCERTGVTALPVAPEDMAEYLAQLAASDGAKRNTIARRAAAINSIHEAAGFARPGATALVKTVLRGIRRDKYDEELNQAAPMTVELLARCVDALTGTETKRARDAALLTLGFAGALRRSELVAVRVRDVVVSGQGAELTIPISKTDQEGAGHKVALAHTCDERIDPVHAITRWMELSGVRSGPLLRAVLKNGTAGKHALNAGSVNTLIQDAVARTGLSPAHVAEFSGHSLRAGFVTSARAAGVADHVIMRTTRHKDARVLGTYTREPDFFATASLFANW